MERMVSHFPRENAPQPTLDMRFASMRSLVQILDAELFELMQRNGDYTHFFFAYRWFLLDFKRELAYDDVFAVWECIWSAPAISTSHFMLFVALALVQFYREIIIDNNMDFTDIIRFFNEMAEKHDARQLLWIARYLVYQLQNLIQNC